MTLTVTHSFVSSKPVGNDSTRIYSNSWNANHVLTGTTDASQLNANVVQSVTNDTNIQGSISAQNLTFSWAGQLAPTRGGTGLATYTLGDTIYASAANTLAALAGNTTSTKKFLTQTGTGTVSAAPVWNTVVAADVGSGAALTKTDDTNVGLTLGGSPSSALLAATSITVNWIGTLANSRLANMNSYTLKGNVTGSAAAPQDFTIDGLTLKGSPASTDELIIWDVAGAAIKKATVSGLAAAAGVASIDTKTGAFTTGNGLDSTAGNVLELTAARRTLPTTQTFTSGSSATYTTPANCLWIEVYMVGGGGGGGGANSGTTAVAGTAGNTSTFNSVNAAGGSGGSASSSAGNPPIGGAGGTGGTGTATWRAAGSPGGNGSNNSTIAMGSGIGGSTTIFGGGAAGLQPSVAVGNAGATNSGGGGGGGYNNSGANNVGGGGGGAGESVYLIINSPSATYTYTVGTGGAGGVATTNGGAGAAGKIFVVEHYGT